jgi:hypothetical protein
MKQKLGLSGVAVSSISLRVGTCPTKFVSDGSLERDYHRRPSPRQLLNNHPWVVGMAKKEVDMERWIREVWQWPA